MSNISSSYPVYIPVESYPEKGKGKDDDYDPYGLLQDWDTSEEEETEVLQQKQIVTSQCKTQAQWEDYLAKQDKYVMTVQREPHQVETREWVDLDLMNCQLTDDHLQPLITLLREQGASKEGYKVRCLNLEANQMSEKVALELAEVLKINTYIGARLPEYTDCPDERNNEHHDIILNNNPFGTKGFIALTEVLMATRHAPWNWKVSPKIEKSAIEAKKAERGITKNDHCTNLSLAYVISENDLANDIQVQASLLARDYFKQKEHIFNLIDERPRYFYK